jgi:hypothetical protein
MVVTPPRDAAARIEREKPWDVAHQALDGQGPASVTRLLPDLRTRAGTAIVPLAIEPDLFYPDQREPRSCTERRQSDQYSSHTSGRSLTVCDTPSIHWPSGPEFGWHLSDRYSELKSAREYVAAKHPPRTPSDRVRIAIIDTGYNEDHVTNPVGLDKNAARDFTDDPLNPAVGARDPLHKGPLNVPGHGASCLAVLAGARIQHEESGFDDYVGGAPNAEILFLRISDSPVHFLPSTMAMAIRYAVANGSDVISLSHGGVPSMMLADAVNEAYEKGTAIFAAAGDFFVTPILGLSTPRNTVYPAAFSRVASVCGVTAQGRTYSKAPNWMSLLTFRRWGDWMLRGSYGPKRVMNEAIAAYTPNITWARSMEDGSSNLIDLDGSGTSAATPQVAAAAALWLQAHRSDPALAGKWRSWEKAESVYLALFDSAEKKTPEGSDTFTYFGNGLLKARRALEMGVPRNLQQRPPARVGMGWLTLLASVTPAIRSTSGTRAGEREPSMHADMVETEIAQLIHGSVQIQTLLDTPGMDMFGAKTPPPEAIRAFLQALRQEKRCSKYLRGVLEKTEAALPPANTGQPPVK